MRRLLGCLLVLAAPAARAAHPDFTGVWQAVPASAGLMPDDGVLPLTAAAAASYAANRLQSRTGRAAWDTTRICIPPGVPRAMAEPMPLEILQEPQKVTILFQLQRLYRTISLNGVSNATSDPTYMGDAMGHWQGDALLVHSRSFKPNTFLNGTGVPHSDQLMVDERWTLRDPNTLRDQIRITDPATFTRPWQTTLLLRRRPGVRIAEDVCVDRTAGPAGR